ncbi:BT_3987 domain-containing protein [Capnocytophaga cynodegmi]|uniref:Putative Conserved Exo-alpha-sialidase n=1 Tax=Capnocytophaga cynodegmi TaxID=28189 RepID=A0A0B7HFH2_9FLAO|nr:DUF1735 domain-containing protein [Capnocytophaga cynodegmi]CEN36637.1 putative Conserved Exo-alpha-sialidase [Capnocytophaga cynodegmi]CEN42304.1 putative Conserved Exo-alpha-sialidase [Capnocytophaga cynodegmi]
MNKYIYISLLFVLGLITLFSCEKRYDDLIPSQYDTILVFQEEGEQNITLYSTGEDGEYDVTILKSGNMPNASAQVKLKAMDATELEFYSQSIGRNYIALPLSAYQLGEENITFSSSEKYKKSKVVFKTNEIKELLDNNTSNRNYILPLELVKANAKDSVNAEKRILLLKPRIVVPEVNYSSNGATVDISNTDVTTYNFTLSLPFVSPWDFECEVALPANGVLTSDQIFFENGNKVSFKKGRSVSEPFSIKVAKTGDLVGKKALVPISIVSSSKSGIQLPENPFNLEVIYGGENNKISLTADMLSSNFPQLNPKDGDGLPALIDNKANTFYHSRWSPNTGDAPHYIMVDLKKSVNKVAFSYQNRNNTNGKVQDIKIWVSNNGTNDWKELTRISSELPTAAASKYDSFTFVSEESFSYFLIEVHKTNSGTAPTFFSMAEFAVYGK